MVSESGGGLSPLGADSSPADTGCSPAAARSFEGNSEGGEDGEEDGDADAKLEFSVAFAFAFAFAFTFELALAFDEDEDLGSPLCGDLGSSAMLTKRHPIIERLSLSGSWLIAYSAIAVMVRLGFTPRLAGIEEPSST